MSHTTVAGKYTLRNKDIPLIKFDLLRETVTVNGIQAYDYALKINYINNEQQTLLPYSLRNELSPENLLLWIERRKAPKNRRFVEQLMQTISDKGNPLAYVDISHALSLNDALWITNDVMSATWKDFNLYKHPFNEVLAYIAFTGHSEKISGVITSPEYTSSGALKKCWSNRADGIYLLKGDDFINYSDGRSQATTEFYAAQIAAIMDFEHIPYDLEEFHHRDGGREIICKCKLFTDENTGYVPAYDFFRDKGLDVRRANLQKILVQDKMAEIYGREKYADLMIFDALICNKDRHLGNFGYLIDNDTGNYLKPAPLFDNGFSLLYGAAKSDMDNLTEYISAITGKYLDFDLAARLFVQPRHIPKIRKLLNFYFIKHPKYNVSDDTLSKMSTFIQLRAKKILELSREKQPIDLLTADLYRS